jgi:diguanylate cyclase
MESRKIPKLPIRDSFFNWIEEAPLPVILFSDSGMIIRFNKPCVRLTGYSAADISVDDSFFASVFGEKKELAANLFHSVFDGEHAVISEEMPAYTKAGSSLLLELYISYIGQLRDGRRVAMCIARDVSEQKRSEAELFRQKIFLETMLVSMADGVIYAGKTGRIIFMNHAAETMTGWTLEEAQYKSLGYVFRVTSEFTRDKNDDIAGRILKEGKSSETRKRMLLISKESIERMIELTASPVFLDGTEADGVVVVFRDCSEHIRRENEVRYLSYHDQLTGLYNRRFYEQELMRLDTERNYPLALVLADVNGLKLTNDAFGHAEGDRLLQKLAGIMKKECRSDDILARIGGDEFVVILPRTSPREAEKFVSRLIETVAYEKPEKVMLSLAVGFAVKEDSSENIENIFRLAEDEMYRQKLYDNSRVKARTLVLILNTLYENNSQQMNHSRRVGDLCASCAEAMNMSPDIIRQVKTAGILHDIGKVGIKEQILKKPEELTDAEWHEIMKYPEIGFRILSSVQELSDVAGYVLQQQEKWDGSGYPYALRGEEISPPARIIAVAAAYDVMTEERPCAATFDPDRAVEEIKSAAGHQFDPYVARVFVEKVLRKRW